MIEEAGKIFDLPTYEIQNRWFGMYAQCKEQDIGFSFVYFNLFNDKNLVS